MKCKCFPTAARFSSWKAFRVKYRKPEVGRTITSCAAHVNIIFVHWPFPTRVLFSTAHINVFDVKYMNWYVLRWPTMEAVWWQTKLFVSLFIYSTLCKCLKQCSFFIVLSVQSVSDWAVYTHWWRSSQTTALCLSLFDHPDNTDSFHAPQTTASMLTARLKLAHYTNTDPAALHEDINHCKTSLLKEWWKIPGNN